MRDLRTLFNAACGKFNNEDLGIHRIKHYPFKKYKVGSAPLTRKRNNTLDDVRMIRDCNTKAGSRAELAKDIYMLSFYLCGMNAVDLYQLTKKDIRNGRIDYNRSKTQSRRKDNAFISIKIIEEAKPLLDKYVDKLSGRYSTYGILDYALSHGMKQLRKLAGIPEVTIYWARHTFATVARNTCRISKDDVALALNHVDNDHRVTDIYIEKDWTIVDEVQSKVICQLRNLDVKKYSARKRQE
jgi:integrase